LRALQRRLGITTIFVTHDQEEALTMADRIAVLDHGHIEQFGPPTEIYEQPRTRFVADFIGLSNFLQARVTAIAGDRVEAEMAESLLIVLAHWPGARLDQRIEVMVRPEKIRMLSPARDPLPGPDHVSHEARLEQVVYQGEGSYSYVQLRNGDRLQVYAPNDERGR
jgi:spermidine/putrescine transport system ATP-binding protein